MRKNKTLLCDVDGVLLSWIPAFNRYMQGQGYNAICNNTFVDAETYNITKAELIKYINNFHSGHWEFGTLPIHADAKEGVENLTEMGYRFVAITSCSTHPQAIALRKANLYNHFGDVFDAVHCIDITDTKHTHLAEYEPTFWIEDQVPNALIGLEYDHDCIVMKHNWNKDSRHNGLILCHTWAEVVEYIRKKNNVCF